MPDTRQHNRPADLNRAAAKAIVGIWSVLLTSTILAACYFGKDIIVPIALASLVSFLLVPWVAWLAKKTGTAASVALTMLLLLAVTIGLGWIISSHAIDLADEIPSYKENLRQKLQVFHMPKSRTMTKLEETFKDLKSDLSGAAAKTPAGQDKPKDKSKPVTPQVQPMPVKIVEPEGGTKMIHLLGNIASPILGPLEDASLVILLSAFMLLKHEDLRSRVFRLFSGGNIGKTTRVMEEAASKVRRYLLMQLVVNTSYGIPLAIGLYFIGVPNALLWGALAAVLRFIPYIGPWIAAAFPVLLSLAVSPDWQAPLLTVGLFLVLELASNNLLEPWLYGSSTGVSSIALILSAVFWTWMWGVPGLILATPITVCLVVMGRHIPQLAFLSVMLGEEEALDPVDECYQRLARQGRGDEIRFTESYLSDHSLTRLYDEVLVPVMIRLEQDWNDGHLESGLHRRTFDALRELVEDMGEQHASAPKEPDDSPLLRISLECADDRRDELASRMLSHLLIQHGHHPGITTGTERINDPSTVDIICISSVYPMKIRQIRRMCQRARLEVPDRPVVVGLWGYPPELLEDDSKALLEAGASRVFSTFGEMTGYAGIGS